MADCVANDISKVLSVLLLCHLHSELLFKSMPHVLETLSERGMGKYLFFDGEIFPEITRSHTKPSLASQTSNRGR